MTLATHTVVGAAVAAALPNHPILGGISAFASHFLLDALPHWDYRILSASANPDTPSKLVFDRLFLLDLLRIGGDGLLGLAVAATFFLHGDLTQFSSWIWLVGALSAILPDLLQFVYSKYPKEPVAHLQAFHRWIHTSRRLEGKHIIGVASQLALAAIVIFFSAF